MRKRDNKQKNSQNKNNEPTIKKCLEDEKIKGKRYVDWRVTRKEDMEYVFKHYYTEISIYSVRTRRFDKELCKKMSFFGVLMKKVKMAIKTYLDR